MTVMLDGREVGIEYVLRQTLVAELMLWLATTKLSTR